MRWARFKYPSMAALDPTGGVWFAAVELYVSDCIAAYKGLTQHSDNGEALDDLLGDRRMLARLCEMSGLDAEWMADGIFRRIERETAGC